MCRSALNMKHGELIASVWRTNGKLRVTLSTCGTARGQVATIFGFWFWGFLSLLLFAGCLYEVVQRSQKEGTAEWMHRAQRVAIITRSFSSGKDSQMTRVHEIVDSERVWFSNRFGNKALRNSHREQWSIPQSWHEALTGACFAGVLRNTPWRQCRLLRSIHV